MVKTKTIKEEGEVISVETEKIQKQPIVISQTQAKKLIKREMSEKQAEHVKKLVEANKVKYEAKKKEKEDAIKSEIDNRVNQELIKKKEGKIQEVIVAPKRIYPQRVVAPKKQPKIIYQEESEDEEEEEEVIIVKKPKKVLPKQREDTQSVDTKIETIKKIDTILKQTNPYANLIRF